MKINEVARLTGITVRTLHYYDEIGLFTPSEITEAGYRIYNEDALVNLQQILLFKELDFSLSDIKRIMENPHYNKAEVLTKHKELLLQKRSHLDGLIALVDHMITGEKTMSFKEFDNTDFEENKSKYVAEVKARWGETAAYKESKKKTGNYDEAKWKYVNKEGGEILKAFGEMRDMLPDSEPVQRMVARWQSYISDNFYECTNEILSGLGLMYTGDERFKENIDRNGKGTAAFMAEAIEIYTYRRWDQPSAHSQVHGGMGI